MASKAGKAAKTATEALVVLWAEGFFRGSKKLGQIETTLAARGNHFSKPALAKALERAKHLTRRGKSGSFEYIQQYPHELDVAPAAGKVKGRRVGKQ